MLLEYIFFYFEPTHSVYEFGIFHVWTYLTPLSLSLLYVALLHYVTARRSEPYPSPELISEYPLPQRRSEQRRRCLPATAGAGPSRWRRRSRAGVLFYLFSFSWEAVKLYIFYSVHQLSNRLSVARSVQDLQIYIIFSMKHFYLFENIYSKIIFQNILFCSQNNGDRMA